MVISTGFLSRSMFDFLKLSCVFLFYESVLYFMLLWSIILKGRRKHVAGQEFCSFTTEVT